MRNVYTVRQVNNYIKNMFTHDFMLNRIYIKGEVSNCKYHTSGHIYFSLKDESGTIACVMFAGARAGLSFRMREGQNVIVLGSVDVYERDGKYQLYAKEIILDGIGLLYEKYIALKNELEEMGMFAEEYKQTIPAFVKKVGIVTAPTGAAIRDIINIAKRRNPYVQLILYPALVQGEGAAESIIKGIQMLELQKPDVIIIGRGGGSIEDLWAFNEEIVARAVFECSIPIISAVGHETDTVITDYVADLRAPTPSAAAELAVYDVRGLKTVLDDIQLRMKRQISVKIEWERKRYEAARLRLKYAHPKQILNDRRQRTANIEMLLKYCMSERIKDYRHKLAVSIERMKGLSPLEKLNQGYAYAETAEGRTLRSIDQVKKEDRIRIYVTDGEIEATITGLRKEERK
ncbi:MAG: exodeoxyribonuclease VII large subunit [Schaedlerella sp.]|nr:exodeoxyribonuclease VII large subunit [Schaedlerella sp.]